MPRAAFTRSAPAASRSLRVVPSSYSITMDDRPSCLPMSWIVQMFGWFSTDAVSASREPVQGLVIARELVGDTPERHRAAEARICGFVQHAHPAGVGDGGDDLAGFSHFLAP